jgi:hypothetical protein
MTGGQRCDRGGASVEQLRACRRRLLKRGRADGAASRGPFDHVSISSRSKWSGLPSRPDQNRAGY